MVKEYYREFQGTTNDTDQDGIPFSWLKLITEPEDTRISKELSKFIVKFITEIKNKFEVKQILHFSNSTVGLFNTIDGPEVRHCYLCYSENILEALKEVNHQLILCDLSAEDEQISPPPYQSLIKCIQRIKETDLAIVAASENNIFTFRRIIEANNAAINGIFSVNLCDMFTEHTKILDGNGAAFIPFESGLYLLLVQRKQRGKEYICHIDSAKSIKNVLEEFSLDQKEGELIYGITLAAGEYIGERAYQRGLRMKKALLNIENRSIDFQVYSRNKISDIALNFKIQEFKNNHQIDFEHCLYINVYDFEHNSEHKPVFSIWNKFSTEPKKIYNEKHYLAIKFDNTLVDPKYIKYFFESKIGELIWESITDKELLSLEDIKNLWLYVPPINSQKEILSTIHKIDESKKNLHDINFDLILNPSAFDDANKKINKILDVFGELADFEKIKSRIYEGESKTLEFKQTFSVDISTQKKEKYIEDACIKTLAAFMNSEGGTLIVGVADNGDLTGLDSEISRFYKNNDSFLLHVKNQIKNRIGEQFYPFINYRLVRLENKTVLCVECLPSSSEVYVDSKDFYVRTNPSTDKLEGPKLVLYIKNHQNFF